MNLFAGTGAAQKSIRIAARHITRGQVWLLWCYVLAAGLAEILIAFVNPQIGQALLVGLLDVLFIHGLLGKNRTTSRLALALTLVPLIRILSLALPLAPFAQIARYSIVGSLILLVTGNVIWQLRLSRAEIGLRIRDTSRQLFLASSGFGLGMIEYALLQDQLPDTISVSSPAGFLIAALSLFIFTGFAEELIFRGLLQSLALRAMNNWGLFYVSILFAVLHIGYHSIVDFIFVLVVGLFFAYVVYRTGTILGVTLAHGLTNITLFLLLPYLEQISSDAADMLFLGIACMGGVLSFIALFSLTNQAQQQHY